MSRKQGWIAVGVVALAAGAFAFGAGGWLWNKLLEMHGMGPGGAARHGGARAAPFKPKAVPDPWPETKAGALARGWVEAFDAGEEAMGAYLARVVPVESLKERSLEERLATYRTNHERFGALRLDTIVRSSPAEVEAILIAADGSDHDFVFEAQTGEPFKLVNVKMIEHRVVGSSG
jgi:hypothetical protein